ncbi:hypothetical protein ND856_18650 [Leptospira bandrabouensis]|uniref:hypothetical protein n=1 Tax=Leptospira bandrabouensis TaxID=2484903 RepID=UPI00223E190F|nr:hypothetical protein [Leptospira bandrabouensis]MCW7460156.1 hypothetical protein [Leptospira bandrabouensis]MCW7479327.1 hypothetical protein [Leptospira bandrabouensis]MCW7487009.1 hypothetical protein [Leptospira bandrabouensis]
MKFKELDNVILTKEVSYVDRGDEGILPAGTKGVVVHLYERDPHIVVVEFFDEDLDTICIEDISIGFLELGDPE